VLRHVGDRLHPCIDKGLTHLSVSQQSTGEYVINASATPDPSSGSPCHSVFPTALVLQFLNELVELRPGLRQATADARNYAGRFLRREATPTGEFQYYLSSSDDCLPYDTDDTSCASAALRPFLPFFNWRMNAELFRKTRKSDGTYSTWLGVTDGVSDVAVNANVLTYLGDTVETSRARDFIARSLTSRPFGSLYYDDFMTLFLVARAVNAGVRSLDTPLSRATELLLEVGPANDLHAACLAYAVSTVSSKDCGALRELSVAPSLSVEITKRLLDRQQADGSWECAAAYRSRVAWYGHQSLSTAVAILAVARTIRARELL
jgi:hypothetical protein